MEMTDEDLVKGYSNHIRAYFVSVYICVYANLPTWRNSKVTVS